MPTTTILGTSASYGNESGVDTGLISSTPYVHATTVPPAKTSGAMRFDLSTVNLAAVTAVTLRFRKHNEYGTAGGYSSNDFAYLRKGPTDQALPASYTAIHSVADSALNKDITDAMMAAVALNAYLSIDVTDWVPASGTSWLLYLINTGINAVSGIAVKDPELVFTTGTEVLSVSLSSSSVTVGNTVTGTVARTGATTSALTVNLSSSATGVATVPATVTIPIGQSSATFTITSVAAGSATITATGTGYTSGTSPSLTVSAAPTLGVTFSSYSIVAGSSINGTVTRSGSTSSAVTVNLSSSATGVATVPATVTIPIGQLAATFTVTSVAAGTATVTATATNHTSGTSPTLTVNALALSTALSATTVAAGATVTLTVTRTGSTSSALTVSLASSATGVATVPGSVNIASGQASATATITAVGAGNVTITATASGYTSSTSATITVTTPLTAGTLGVITTRMRAKNLSRALNGVTSLRARLFTNDAVITTTMVPIDFTEPNFTGYAQLPISITPESSLAYALGVRITQNEPELRLDPVEWTNEGATSVTIRGMFIIDLALATYGDVAGAVKFAVPRIIAPGGRIKLPTSWFALNAT